MHTKLFLLLLAAAAVFNSVYSSQVCYDDLGCFSTDAPFSASGRIARLPESPEDVDIHFYLYTRKNADAPQEIVAKDVDSLRRSNFNATLPIKFILHGYIDGPGIGPWMEEMARQFLVVENCNAFVVDWSQGGRALYSQAAANSRVAGALVAQLVEFLSKETVGLDPGKIHILGHSLGSHAAGYAGERIPGCGRITGMDPAGPYFQGMDPRVRLDETDALFVDAIHTDGNTITVILNPFDDMNGMGMMEPAGHIDVYANGGMKQPGCGDRGPINLIIGEGIVEGARYLVACAHMRSIDYTYESISSACPWRTYRCDEGYDEFLTGRCLKCPTSGDKTKGCNSVSSISTKPSDGSAGNKFYMVTGDKEPFCRYHYHIHLAIDSENNKEQKGLVWVKLFGDGLETDFVQLGDDNFYITPGAAYDFLITSPVGIKTVSSVEVKWEHDANFYEIGQWQWGTPTIVPGHINVFSGEYQADVKYCDNGHELKSKDSRRLTTSC